MNFYVRRHGADLGVCSLEQLRQRRERGEFDGREYVQQEGSTDWQPLDLVLEKGYRVAPPRLPTSVSAGKPLNPFLIWGMIVLVLVFGALMVFFFIKGVRRGFEVAQRQRQSRYLNEVRPDAVAAASRPVVWTTNTLTYREAQGRAREFRIREWLNGYEQRGQRNPRCDAEVIQYLQVWIARNYGGNWATNSMSLQLESERLETNSNCTDPLVLTVVGVETPGKGIDVLQRAVKAFPQSGHQAYPQFYAMVSLANRLNENQRDAALETSMLQQFQKCFTDGSFTANDQQEIAEIFLDSWGKNFFPQRGDAICKIVDGAGDSFNWLALVLRGENEINAAWKARGNGYASTVGPVEMKQFHKHLALARRALTNAWDLHHDWPQAACRMMTVALGDSGINEMRVWFDRATVAQIDYPGAWSEMRWGLRPRWYGNEKSMLLLGRTALNTGRFDTKVPEQFIDCVYDVESEMGLSSGKLFSRSDIWPDLQRVYEGYIRQTVRYPQHHREWMTAYAIAAYQAKKYDVSREQLEAMNWTPSETTLAAWNLDATLWPLEIAARTGPIAKEINPAESFYEKGNWADAKKRYLQLELNSKADARTKEFIRRRLMLLGQNLLITPQFYPMSVSTN